jgi:hypothetical protein
VNRSPGYFEIKHDAVPVTLGGVTFPEDVAKLPVGGDCFRQRSCHCIEHSGAQPPTDVSAGGASSMKNLGIQFARVRTLQHLLRLTGQSRVLEFLSRVGNLPGKGRTESDGLSA